MKKLFTVIAALLMVVTLSAANLAGKRIYVNPGHGSFGPNDRPMATIPYPALASTGMPDTCGFYESNTNLWKCLYLRDRLVAAGATVVMSREECGPWPYAKVNGEYPSYSWEDYKNRSDYEKYNKALSVICEEVESGNYDVFISVHSNAASDGTTTNYPIWLYRGYDACDTQFEKDCKAFGAAMWPYRFEPMTEGYDHHSYYSATNMALRGDVSFMGSGSTSTRSNGKQYYGYYGVLKHGTVGGIFEGYFHTYQPARHRALNVDNCHMEGYCYYRGIIDYFGADKDTKGYILGLIKDEHEKISHKLYNYAPKMHDQWLPLNGAKVTLYKGNTKIGEYTVDNNYNGVFYFGDLEPGNDYWLDATCEGYKPMWDEYKAPITVTANKITYPRIYLENESWEEEVVLPDTYPEPDVPASVGIAGRYEMTQTFADAAIAELDGKTIRRSIVRNDTTMYVLALDGENNPYLYLINPSTQAVKATLPTDFCSVSAEGKLKLSDIAVTAEGVLIGCNEEKTTYTPANKWLVYKWTETAGVWSGAVWLNTTNNETAGNFSNAISGTTIAYAGTLTDGYLYTTAYTIGTDAHAVRFVCYTIADDKYAGAFRNQDAAYKLTEMGHDIQFTISPLADDRVIITDANIVPMECEFATTTAAAPKNVTVMPEAFMGVKGLNFFKYAKHKLMTAPLQAEGQNTGVQLYDITNGVAQPQAIKLSNNTLAAKAAGYIATAGVVKGQDITLYLQRDNTISRITTAGVEQPVIAHVNAYGLNVAFDEGTASYTFTYTANSNAVATNIVFYQEGEEVGKVAVTPAVKGANNAVIARADLPGFTGTPTNWAVELIGESVPAWGELHAQPKADLGMARVFNTIDNNPENATFQRIYLADYVRNSANSGLYIVNPDYTRENLTPMLGGNALFGCLYRISIDQEGYVYMPDWTDGNSGVYTANPNDFSTFPNMFQGTRDANGVISNNGVEVGSSTPAVYVYGKGADTKLIVYNEDPGTKLVTNGLCIYNIGQPDGSIKRTWNEAPSKVLSIPGQANSEGNVYATERGIWVSQNRSNGNNNSSATSLQFFDWNGNRKFSSAVDPYNDIIIGSEGSAFALSRDEKMLVLNNGDREFMVFDVEWQADNTPVLTLRHAFKHSHGTSTTDAFRQLSFDYGGNLIATGDPGFYVFTVPTDKNVTVVPAKSTLTVEKPFSGHVEGVLLDKTEATLVKGETLTLTATVMPEAATNKNVTWTSSNEAAATVANGVVTAVASGKTTITVKTEEGEFTATCAVTVITPVTGVTLDKSEAALTKGQTLTLVATVAPAEADNKTIIWSSSNEAAATVTNGVVKAVASGKATITAKTEDGEFTATCAVTVTTPVTGVELDKTELTLTEGDTETLTATVVPADADNMNVTWSSSNEAIAKVANGVVTAVAEGNATITVTTAEGNFTATCAVTVEKRIIHVTGVTLNETTLSFDLRETDKLTATLVATIAPNDATDKSVTWTSDNDAVATVADGLVTAVGVGNTTITVTTTDGNLTATCAVEVILSNGIYQISVDGISYSDYTIHNANSLSLMVYTSTGKLVATGNADISLSSMPAGTYLVRTPNGNVLKVLR
jgi:Bacterial surface proteins containing Ig-like domains